MVYILVTLLVDKKPVNPLVLVIIIFCQIISLQKKPHFTLPSFER